MSNIKPIIQIIGANGMLGQMAVNYFSSKGFTVIAIDKRFEEASKWEFISAINEHKNSVLINCIGRIKQKTNSEVDLLWANAVLPLALANSLDDSITLIHPSTDCVFDGNTNEPYSIHTLPNAMDSYGWSKRLGEVALMARKNTFIIRVSIIGPDNNKAGKGLLAWFLSNSQGAELKGFTNHLWNGITTLEWCKQVEVLLSKNKNSNCELLQLGTNESYSKYEMLLLFQKYYNTHFVIRPFEAAEKIDRRLKPTLTCKDLDKQLAELQMAISII